MGAPTRAMGIEQTADLYCPVAVDYSLVPAA